MNIAALARPEVLALKPYVSARSEAPGKGVLLNANEAPRPLLDPTISLSTTGLPLNRYPDPQPKKLVKRMARRYGVDREQTLVTRGSDEGIDLLLRVFCRPGEDAILECPPCFGMYRVAAGIQGAAVLTVPRDSGTLRPSATEICQALADDRRIRLVFLTSPNNPTGDTLSAGFVMSVLEAAEDQALVVLDEAYAEFCPERSLTSLLGAYRHLVLLRTLSKATASAGLRCGAVLADPEVIGLLRRVISPYPLATPVISLALTALDPECERAQRQLLAEIEVGKRHLLDLLEGRPFVRQLWRGEANFVLARLDDGPAFVAHCRDRGVLVRSFDDGGLLADCVRITVGSERDLAAFASCLDSYGSRP